jgi:hypothetical protein
MDRREFALGALFPLLVIMIAPKTWLIASVAGTSLLFLVVLGVNGEKITRQTAVIRRHGNFASKYDYTMSMTGANLSSSRISGQGLSRSANLLKLTAISR